MAKGNSLLALQSNFHPLFIIKQLAESPYSQFNVAAACFIF